MEEEGSKDSGRSYGDSEQQGGGATSKYGSRDVKKNRFLPLNL